MEQPKKHPTFQNRPVPSFQLLSKLSKFQGERKDILAKNPQDILASTRNAYEDFQTMMDSPNPNVCFLYKLILAFLTWSLT